MISDVAAALREEAMAVNERRLLVLAGDHEACLEAAADALRSIEVDPAEAVVVGKRTVLGVERVEPRRTDTLLGTTHDALVFDAHAGLRPNAIGQVVGAVRGGGLLLLLAPPLGDWPNRRDPADEAFAVPPFDVEEVTGNFRSRFVETLRAHRGVAIVDVDEGAIEDDGLAHPAPRFESGGLTLPAATDFPPEAYEACLTDDQIEAVRAFEALLEPGNAVVVEADRGRGKSSAAGLAAGALAARGEDVLVTAPQYRSARELFARAEDLLDALGVRAGHDGDQPKRLETAAGGRVRFAMPADATEANPDVVVVDEAAALPVGVLSSFLDAGRVAFATTIHGYEGAGRGFSVRFRDDLAASDLDVIEVRMDEPIRYAAGDPVEVWAFRALLLDASPAPDQVLEDARPETVTYRALDPADLLGDEPLLREAFGLLVLAHYRTQPADLARLLDAPNVAVRALLHESHVASVVLLAREGGLSKETREHMYEGGRVRGNMIPDVLTSQLGDEAAGAPVGWRVLRIATHDAIRSRGLGSHLLARVREECSSADWLGVGYGATPELLSFWDRNGFSTVHLSTTRNESSGEHSAIMLSPRSREGEALHDRHATAFADRIPAVLSDALSDLDPDVVRGALRAAEADVDPDLTDREWRQVARMAFGPGLMDVDPGPFRELARKHLLDPARPDLLSPRAERLLVQRVLQARGWTPTAEELGFPSRRECMRALGRAFRPLIEEYGDEAATEEATRFGR